MTKIVGCLILCLVGNLCHDCVCHAATVAEKSAGMALRTVAQSGESFTFLFRQSATALAIKVNGDDGLWLQAPLPSNSRIQQDLAATKLITTVNHTGERFSLVTQDRTTLINAIKQFLNSQFEPNELKTLSTIPQDELKTRHTSALIAIKAKRIFSHRLAADGKRIHVVKKGETLWRIAKAYYEDGTLWQLIRDANPHILGDDGSISVGDELIVP